MAKIGLRPDRATLSYCQRAREAFKGVPVIAGGVEASLRRLAHYDYWSDKVRKSILLDSKADLVVFGMGENAIVEIAQRLEAGETVKDLRDMRGVAYALGASETVPNDVLTLPSYEEVVADKMQFAEATRIIHQETNPYNAKRLVQWHANQAVVVNPPQLPISEGAMDRIYGLPYTRRAHPSYKEPIPAHEMIKDSVTIMRGCFGGCTLLFHYSASRSSYSIAEQSEHHWRDRETGQGQAVQRDRERHRWSNRQYVSNEMHTARGRGQVSSSIVRASKDLQVTWRGSSASHRADA